MDKAGKIIFATETSSDVGLEFLDLKFKIDEVRFELIYLLNLPTICAKSHLITVILRKNICNITKDISLRPRRKCDDDDDNDDDDDVTFEYLNFQMRIH